MAGTCHLCLPGPQLPHLQKEGPDRRPWEAHPACPPSLSFQACPQRIGPLCPRLRPFPCISLHAPFRCVGFLSFETLSSLS